MLGILFSIIYLCHDSTSETNPNPLNLLIWALCPEKNQGGIPAARHHAVPLQSLAPLYGTAEDAAVPAHLPALQGEKASARLFLLNIVHSH